MNLHWIDWLIVAAAVVLLRFVSLYTKQYVKGVADFLSANRSAGRYLLTIAGVMGGTGVIFFVGLFEQYSKVGFTSIWWGFMVLPIPLIALLTGWLTYRFRETRAMTLAQFFEMRYSRRFRVFTGVIIFISGILNFGIFPAVAARFFVYFCGLPDTFCIPGVPWHISTFATVMIIDMVLALTFVTMGGQVSVMVTECVQGMFCGIAVVLVSVFILVKLGWVNITAALNTAPTDASMLHPFHTSGVDDFNFWFFLIVAVGQFYNWMSWQGTSGFQSAPRTPHEGKMGGIIGVWRINPMLLGALLMGIAGYAVLHLPQYADEAAKAGAKLQTISNSTIQTQMSVPVALSFLLPIGLKGILVTLMLFGSFASHDTYMHSWGTIFIQDVVMPFRKKPLDHEQHIRWLRWAITGVAVWAVLFGLLYQQTEKIMMFCAITGVIWMGGAGAVIIGGLYWRRGTTIAAYSALIFGAALGIVRIIIPRIYQSHYHRDFPINGQWTMLIGIVGASLVYVIVSLITCRGTKFNLERILHRGKYAEGADHVAASAKPVSRWTEFVGITNEFSFTDKCLAIALVVWNLGWAACFFIITVLNLAFDVGTSWWTGFWHFYVVLQLAIGIPATIWFTIGGLVDIKALFKTLSTAVRNHSDDGRVADAPEVVTETAKSE